MSAAAKLEADPMKGAAADVHLEEIVARVASRHKPIAEQRGVELNWSVPEAPLVVTGDPTLVEQAASNLVQNAVQYNGPGGHVSIILERTAGGFELCVIDDGPGIPPDMMEDVIKRGVRSDEARSRNEGGQGFGLAIAHQVCERHGWKLELSPRDDGGTVAKIVGAGLAPAADPLFTGL
ncbi:MAG: sensor histidine kinase [Bradymonadaceae bacterium]